MRFAPGVDVHEGAGSHGDLHVSGFEAALAEHRRLLVRHLKRDGAPTLFREHRVPNKNVLSSFFFVVSKARKEEVSSD